MCLVTENLLKVLKKWVDEFLHIVAENLNSVIVLVLTVTSSPEGVELEDMEFRLCCWMVVFLLKKVSTDLSSHTKYTLSQSEAAFDQAMQNCKPGVLATVATEHELQEIVHVFNKSKSLQANITVWIGLKKPKSECIISEMPLRGFKWAENGNQDSNAINWLEEPKLTCTVDLCGALRRQVVQSNVTWGLIPDSCKTPYQFICKGSDGPTEMSMVISRSTIRPVSAEPQMKTATTSQTTLKPATPHPKIPTIGPETCEHSRNPKHPKIRSLTPDSSNSSKVLVECWSEVKIDLICSGVPAVWRVLDGSPANFSIICQQCEKGYQKDDSGLCVDIDECSSGNLCQQTCLNTEGSYKCVCAAEQDSSCEDVPPASDKKSLSYILIPVLAVVAVLLVILVIIAVVKCCLKKRKKKTKP